MLFRSVAMAGVVAESSVDRAVVAHVGGNSETSSVVWVVTEDEDWPLEGGTASWSSMRLTMEVVAVGELGSRAVTGLMTNPSNPALTRSNVAETTSTFAV